MFRNITLATGSIASILRHNKCFYAQHKQPTTADNSASLSNKFVLEPAHIAEAIQFAPTLANVTPELWRQTHATFINHGIYTPSFLRIVTGNPAIATRSPQKIIESIELWRSCQFGETLLHLLITKYPELLNISDSRWLLQQIAYLKGFVSTDKNVWKLLMNCPTLIQQPRTDILQKFDYLQKAMRIEVPEIVKSEALSQNVSDIRCRHVFLDRLGLFKPRNPKADERELSKNPRLNKITDTSDKTFATKVCHVSLDEFEAFKELFERERLRRQRDDDLADDDLDDDDDDDYTDLNKFKR